MKPQGGRDTGGGFMPAGRPGTSAVQTQPKLGVGAPPCAPLPRTCGRPELRAVSPSGQLEGLLPPSLPAAHPDSSPSLASCLPPPSQAPTSGLWCAEPWAWWRLPRFSVPPTPAVSRLCYFLGAPIPPTDMLPACSALVGCGPPCPCRVVWVRVTVHEPTPFGT